MLILIRQINTEENIQMEKQKKTLTLGKIVVYSVGIFGIQLLIGYINTYQSQFYTSVLAADLTKCALIILIAKIISSFADPIIGNIIDSAHFKSGKMKPFVAMSILPFAIITTLMFVAFDFKSDFSKYAYITVTTVLWNVAMSFADLTIIAVKIIAAMPIATAEMRYSFFVMTADFVSVQITGTMRFGATSARDLSIFAIPAQLFFSSLDELKTASMP